MSPEPTNDITLLLQRYSNDPQAAEELLPRVYGELQRIAMRNLRKERAGHSLQTTDLVHEAYLRLVGQQDVDWRERGHFFAVASMAMRRVLVDHARRKDAGRRISPQVMVPLEDSPELADSPDFDLLALDLALTRLAELDAQQAKVVELRYFAGLSLPRIAEALDVSESTVTRSWRGARLWLRREMTSGAS